MTDINDLGFDMGDRTLRYDGVVVNREQKQHIRRKKRFGNTAHDDMMLKYARERDKRVRI